MCSLRDRRTNGKPTKQGFEYTRSDNPNRNLLESLLASLEAGGSTALALASGSAATGLFVAALGANAHVVSVNDVYGGTARYLRNVASVTQNLSTTFVDLERATDEEILNSFKENTRAVWIETPTNPTLRLIDIPRIVRLAKQAPSRPLVLVDNTFMSPFYQSPLLLGADLVLHSITKYINGHSDVLMGAIILPPAETIAGKGGFGTAAAPGNTLEARLRYLQNAMGGVPGAYDSWLAQRGAKTLALRMKAHGANALRLARWLSTRGVQLGLVKGGPGGVVYPGLPSTASGGRKGFEPVRDILISPHARK
jgi:cystathionine gamma-lyase